MKVKFLDSLSLKTVPPSPAPSGRIFWLDVARGFAILTVLLIHTVDTLAPDYALDSTTKGWLIHSFVRSIGRLGVPLFFMISGDLLLSRKIDSSWGFYKKRLPKLFIGLILFACLYHVFGRFFLGSGLESNFYESFVSGTLQFGYQLWFLYVMIGLYFAAPFLSAMLKNIKTNDITAFMALTFFFAFLIPNIQAFFHSFVFPPIEQGLFTYYIAYFVAGYWIVNRSSLARLSRAILSFIFFLSLVLLVLAQAELRRRNLLFGDGLEWYNSGFIFVASCVLLELFRRTPERLAGTRFGNAMSLLAFSSYTIYLVHLFPLYLYQEASWRFICFPKYIPYAAAVPLGIALELFFGLIVFWSVKPFPLLAKYFA